MTTTASLPIRRRGQRLASAVGAIAVAVVVLSGCLNANQTRMVDLVNASRRGTGRSAMVANQTAADKAQAWAAHMARTGVVEHTGGGSRVNTSGLPRWCSVGENVGRGSSIDDVHARWMRSSPHKSNILGNYDRIGTGVVRKGSSVYAVQIFYRAC